MTPRSLPCLAVALVACAAPHKPVANQVATPPAPMIVRTDPKLIDMLVEPTTTLVPASASSELGVRVEISAHESPDAKRPPLDLALVVDTSGSMEGDAIEAVRASARQLVDKLQDSDHISVVE